MKKNILKASAAALAALLFLPGCNREAPITDEVRSESIPLWFESTEGPETRVAVDGTTGIGTWTEGDMIAVWISGPGAEFYQMKAIDDIEVGNESTGHVMISMAVDQNRANYAIYPHTAAVEDHHSADDLYITYPSEYDYSRVASANLADYSPTPMVAINNPIDHSDPSAAIPPLEFYHVGGVYRVTVKNVPSAALSLRFTFPEGMKFSGTFKVTNGGTNTATLSDIAGETYGNVITIKLPIDNPGGDLTLNIPLPNGDYTPATGADRQYKVEALSEHLAFMAIDDYVNWKGLRRAEGKLGATFPLETLGTMNGLYLTRGYLTRNPVNSVKPAEVSISGADQIEVISYHGTDIYNVARKFYFTNIDLGKIMTGDSSFAGATSFEDAELTIDGVKYRVPTRLDWYQMVNFERPGATVNGTAKRRYSKVSVNLDGSNYSGWSGKVNGLLIYPDGGTFTTTATNFNSGGAAFAEISYSEYRSLCDYPTGCIFLPCAGYHNGNQFTNGGSSGHYWSSTVSGLNAYCMTFNASSVDLFASLNKTTQYAPVRLIRE